MPKPTLHLTFDDGPYEPATALVLRVLKKHEVRATFFLCSASNGIKEARQYQLIQQMREDGHALANHGDDHKPMTHGGYRGVVKGNTRTSSRSSSRRPRCPTSVGMWSSHRTGRSPM